jgi:dihydrofolate synthase / folylpolyglutamate synthase
MSASGAMDYAAATDYLFARKARGTKFGIDRVAPLLAALGNPERGLPVVHVAGTNGKGSVAAMLEAIWRTAGWRVGLFTSPHLVTLGERVQVNRKILSEEAIVDYVQKLRPMAVGLGGGDPDDEPSFFELMTAMAFLEFRRERCDLAVIEVGLGGRLDATNVVAPDVSVITSIGLDHCELLGDTIEKIAAEKAGIIKPGRPVVIGRLPPAAERVVRAVATARAAAVRSVAEEFGNDLARYPETNLEGDYQRWNAATAMLVARVLAAKWQITDEHIARGLCAVEWAGRWQRTQVGGRLVVLDASHNPEGAHVLETNLSRLVAETGKRPVVIVGVLGAARARPLMDAIARHAREIHLVIPNQPRACGYEELEALVPAAFRGRVVRAQVTGSFPAPNTCAAGGPDDVVVVTGSIYLLGEVMTQLRG